MTGHMNSAQAMAGEALDLVAQTDQETYVDVALCAQAHVRAWAGELDDAREGASGVLDRLAGRQDFVLEGMAREALAHAALQAGDLAEVDRQRNERRRAQEVLERAVAVLGGAGALGWAAVARAELTRARGRRGHAARLTATERTICELAGAGMRNREIAAQLFLSGKTVEA